MAQNTQVIGDLLHSFTKGRPYVFVIMPYEDRATRAKKGGWLFDTIRRITEQQFNIACLRAVDVLGAGHELHLKIRFLIDRAHLVVAEVSEERSNVFYELGYAMGAGKLPLLLIKKKKSLPYDLRGLEVFEYEDSFDGMPAFESQLAQHLRVRLRPDPAHLRDMLGPSDPDNAYIVTSPKYPGKHSRIRGQVFDSRTFGDHLGILGLISAFGSMYGETKNIELISAQHAPPDLLSKDLNLYFIGSRKVNAPAGEMLDRLQQRVRWVFAPAPGSRKGERDDDWPVALYEIKDGRRQCVPGTVEKLGKRKAVVWTMDHGLIVRGPHPDHPHRLVLILAGSHSLGTGAACLAATRSSLIKELREKLPPGTLEDKQRTFWALVRGTVSRKDSLLDEGGVTIVDAAVYS